MVKNDRITPGIAEMPASIIASIPIVTSSITLNQAATSWSYFIEIHILHIKTSMLKHTRDIDLPSKIIIPKWKYVAASTSFWVSFVTRFSISPLFAPIKETNFVLKICNIKVAKSKRYSKKNYFGMFISKGF